MALSLADLLARIRAALMDAGSAIWDDAALTEAARLALGEYQAFTGAAVTVSGLDGAAVTTLNPLHASLVVWGAAGFAALSRGVDRAESFQLGSRAADLERWGAGRLAEFRGLLREVFPPAGSEPERLKGLRETANAPWGAWVEEGP